MPRVVHFEVHASNPEAVLGFYRTLFGWEFQYLQPMDYWLINTGPAEPGINGGMLRRRGPVPAEGQAVNAFVCTVGVADVDATVSTATSAGGSVALAKMTVPGIGWLAYLKDPDGNIFGVLQPDVAAK